MGPVVMVMVMIKMQMSKIKFTNQTEMESLQMKAYHHRKEVIMLKSKLIQLQHHLLLYHSTQV